LRCWLPLSELVLVKLSVDDLSDLSDLSELTLCSIGLDSSRLEAGELFLDERDDDDNRVSDS